MLDMNAAREAAERVRAWMASPVAGHDGLLHDAHVASRYLLWLTDTTPLTWDVVCKEPGWKPDGHNSVRFGNFRCTYLSLTESMFFKATEYGNFLRPWPTTLGELRQLMMRVESNRKTGDT